MVAPTGMLIGPSHELALARRSFLLKCYATATFKSLKRSATRHEWPICPGTLERVMERVHPKAHHLRELETTQQLNVEDLLHGALEGRGLNTPPLHAKTRRPTRLIDATRRSGPLAEYIAETQRRGGAETRLVFSSFQHLTPDP